MDKGDQMILEEVDETTSLVISYKAREFPEEDDNDSVFSDDGQDYELFSILKKKVMNIRNIVNNT
jgi:hypothetical protein